MDFKSVLKTLNEYAPTISAFLIALGLIFGGKIVIEINQDLTEIKGKIAEYETIYTKNLSSGRVIVDCPDDKEAILTYEENDMVIFCE